MTSDEQLYRFNYHPEEEKLPFVEIVIEDFYPIDHPLLHKDSVHPDAQAKQRKFKCMTNNKFKVVNDKSIVEEDFNTLN